MKPKLSDIAERTGLSMATVSRALHREDSPYVSQQTRQRVQEVARDLGYRANALGRQLATGRSHTIAYWTFEPFAPYYVLVAQHISHQAAQRGYNVIISNRFDPESSALGGKALTAVTPFFDGVIACDAEFGDSGYITELQARKPPLVEIGLIAPSHGDSVLLDFYSSAVQAVRHLVEAGCGRIAFMTTVNPGFRGDPRTRAYETTLREAGLAPEWISIEAHRRHFARSGVGDYVREQGLPDAVFCINDEVAVGCLRGLSDLGIRVPDDVLLVGCDGIAEAEYQTCPISTIVAPLEQMCHMAWDFLEARLADPEAPVQQAVLQTQFLPRESSRSIRKEEPVESQK